jgi:hypothetical protein
MKQLPTAEFFRGTKLIDSSKPYTEEEIMIEFAKLHVESALKEASEKAKITYEYSGNTGSEYCDEFVDKDSILNSYPLDKIK